MFTKKIVTLLTIISLTFYNITFAVEVNSNIPLNNNILLLDTKIELDNYINKIKLYKETLSLNEYNEKLDNTLSKITILLKKYSNNISISKNLNYLYNEISILKSELPIISKVNTNDLNLNDEELEKLVSNDYYSLKKVVDVISNNNIKTNNEISSKSLSKNFIGTGEINTSGETVTITYQNGDIEELQLQNGIFYFKNGKNYWATGPWKGKEVDYGVNSPSNAEMKEMFSENFVDTFNRSIADWVVLDWKKIESSSNPEQEVSKQIGNAIKGKYDPILRKTGDMNNAELSIVAENGKIIDNVGSIYGVKGEGLKISIDEDKMKLYGYSTKEIKEYKNLLSEQAPNLSSFGKLTQTEIKKVEEKKQDEIFGADGFNKYGIDKYGMSKYISYTYNSDICIGGNCNTIYNESILNDSSLKNELNQNISKTLATTTSYIKRSGYDPDQFDDKQKLLLAQYMNTKNNASNGEWHIPTKAELEWIKGADIKPTDIVYGYNPRTGKTANIDLGNFEKKSGDITLVKIDGVKTNDLTREETEKKYPYDLPEFKYIEGQINPNYINNKPLTGDLKVWNDVYNEIYGTNMPKSLAENYTNYNGKMNIPALIMSNIHHGSTNKEEISIAKEEIKNLITSGKVKEANFIVGDNIDLSNRAKEINKIYQENLGRNADINGLKAWNESSYDISQITALIKNSREYKQIQQEKINSLDTIDKVYEQKYELIFKGDNIAPTSYITTGLPILRTSTENAVNLAIELLKNDLSIKGVIDYSKNTDLKRLEKGDLSLAKQILERDGYRVDSTSDYGYAGIRGFEDLSKIGFKYYQEPVVTTPDSPLVKNTADLSAREKSFNDLYVNLLKRNADVNSLKTWVNSTYTLEQVTTAIKKSDEYASKNPTRSQQIEKIYNEVLGRTSDEAGLKYREGTDMTIDEIKQHIQNSEEAITHNIVGGNNDNGNGSSILQELYFPTTEQQNNMTIERYTELREALDGNKNIENTSPSPTMGTQPTIPTTREEFFNIINNLPSQPEPTNDGLGPNFNYENS